MQLISDQADLTADIQANPVSAGWPSLKADRMKKREKKSWQTREAFHLACGGENDPETRWGRKEETFFFFS